MKTIKKLVFLIFFISAISFSQSEGKNFIDQPYIEVTGQIETEVIPNEIYLSIVLNENDKKGKVSIEKQENQMITILKTLNIDLEKNFSILDFDGFYKRKFLGENEVTKTKRYQLIVNDGETLGKVYQSLDRIDVSNISITKTSHSDIEKITRETKLKALKVAKEKAEDYATAINQSLGKALFIQEQSINRNLYANNLSMLNEVVVVGYGATRNNYNPEKIQNLSLQPIIITATILTKFVLN